MKNKNMVLLKTLLVSTSSINKIKYSKDRKIRGKAIGTLIGLAVIFTMIAVYAYLLGTAYGVLGLGGFIPVMFAAMISSMAFFLTLFKTNGYLFAFKEYDMLMALPVSESSVAGNKFLYMYIKSMPWYQAVSVRMLLAFVKYTHPEGYICLLWIVLSLVLPVIPMLAASFAGYFIAKLTSGFRHKNIIGTLFIFRFILAIYAMEIIIPMMVESGKSREVMGDISRTVENAGRLYLPVKWFSDAITGGSLPKAAAIIVLSYVLYTAVFRIIGRNYRKINSNLKSQRSEKTDAGDLSFRKYTAERTIAKKEFRRILSSQVYLVNAGIGILMTAAFTLASWVLGIEKILLLFTKGTVMNFSVVYPAIPLFVYFFVGMVATTAITPSLEGKNYWIISSLPIDKRTVFRGKMLFNIYMSVPLGVISVIVLSASAKLGAVNTLLNTAQITAMCLFSTAFGCVCGIKHMKLDWENETEVVKQGAAVALYLFPNMCVTMALMAGICIGSARYGQTVISCAVTAAYAVLRLVCYGVSLKMADNL